LRYFQPHYADATTPKTFFNKHDQPKIIFFLADGQADYQAFQNQAIAYPNPLTLYVLCDNAPQLKQVVAEAVALETIQTERAELKSDPVSQRELKERLQAVRALETALLNQNLEQPETKQWYWAGKAVALPTKKHMQNLLSEVLESVFHPSPPD